MDGTTRIHLDADDFMRYLDERAAMQAIAISLECEPSSRAVCRHVKYLIDENQRLKDRASELEKANKAWAGVESGSPDGARA